MPSQNHVVGGVGILVNSNNNTIEGNFIGSDTTGMLPMPNFTGITIASSAVGNLIGGSSVCARNLLGGNYGEDYVISGVVLINGTNTTVQGNTVGLTAAGSSFLMIDATLGINMLGDSGTTIQGNVVSGHRSVNISIHQANNELVQDNFVGTDVSGTIGITNNGNGIYIYDSLINAPTAITIDGNTVSANTYGIRVGESAHSLLSIIGTQITNNKIGTDMSGSFAIANSLDGIWIKFAQNIYIAGNTISGNIKNGITLGKSKNSNIKSNLIGTASDGTTPLGNGRNGIELGIVVGVGVPSFGDIVGGALPGEGNTIAFNSGNGISIFSYTQQETIIGNTIINNGLNGILVNSFSSNNWIGGFRTAGNELIIGGVSDQFVSNLGPLGTSNILSNNGLDGIKVINSGFNALQANSITNNGNSGIEIVDASYNLVGGKEGGSTVPDPTYLPVPVPLGNAISGNNGFGVAVFQTTCKKAIDNTILSNSIANNAKDGITLAKQ